MPFFHNDGVELFYTSEGTGPPILLLHGWACDSHDWSFQIPFLLDLGFNVIALDQRGHGRSTAPSSYSTYDLNNYAADAIALLKHLNIKSAILIGHSMGTVISSVIASTYPEYITALVLVHPIYGSAPPALPQIAQEMRANPDGARELAEDFWKGYMYKDDTPAWLKTWTLRRLVGMPLDALIGSIVCLVNVFGTVMGQTEDTKAFMQKRKGPRLVFTTLPPAEPWERVIGVEDGVDGIHPLTQGTFSHIVQHEEFNKILGDWLSARGFVVKK
ncbi:alpha/beta-hydrolase [Lophiostoma macrostomum CBS 122681]|uniref:Alpha/beta-hydrolase n=1 Tax=Lophiostoma macrostomum CBS 122681 TaxID=1314788 RepID=A0A6A6TAK1_9PLEO|nr:alpha/beta-hydrolase [Lophiostoma macrostomum CBS 122681]